MKLFITSSLPYVNSTPHLGNLIGSTLSGDVLARYKRSRGFEVIYLCGTDEYGSATTIKARQENISCQDICDKYHVIHKKIYDWFNIKFDIWGRTSTKSQTMITHEIFSELYKNGYIDEKILAQMYCIHCKLFLADRYVKGECYNSECLGKNNISNGDQCDFCQSIIDVNKLINPFCSLCNKTPVLTDTKHLFLKLDSLSSNVINYLETGANFKPSILSITKNWLSKGLTPRCITRDLEWGTPVPIIGPALCPYALKVFYVWFDAPFGYYSILAENMPNWKAWLCDPKLEWISTQAKDNVPFHTIFFPASILGSKLNYPLINQICGTDYLLFEGKKFSKSNSIGLFGDQVMEISKKLDINEDYWRFYLIKIRPETQDSSFNLKEFVSVINADLASNIGNFVNRCVALTKNHSSCKSVSLYDDVKLGHYVKDYVSFMDNFKFRDALNTCLELSDYGNQCLQTSSPWSVARSNITEAQNSISKINIICWVLLNLLAPFIPGSVERIFQCFKSNAVFDHLSFGFMVDISLGDNFVLPFQKIKYDDLINALA